MFRLHFWSKKRTEIILIYWRNLGVQAGVPVSQSLGIQNDLHNENITLMQVQRLSKGT